MRIEARAIPGADPRALLEPVLMASDVSAEWLSSYPALALEAGHPLATLAAELSGNAPQAAVSFGTEAGLFQQAGVPAIVCDPGDIGRAHRPEEYLREDELASAVEMILALGRHLC